LFLSAFVSTHELSHSVRPVEQRGTGGSTGGGGPLAVTSIGASMGVVRGGADSAADASVTGGTLGGEVATTVGEVVPVGALASAVDVVTKVGAASSFAGGSTIGSVSAGARASGLPASGAGPVGAEGVDARTSRPSSVAASLPVETAVMFPQPIVHTAIATVRPVRNRVLIRMHNNLGPAEPGGNVTARDRA
jgi:hypothetical protein